MWIGFPEDAENSQPQAGESDDWDVQDDPQAEGMSGLVFGLASWVFWPYALAFQAVKWSVVLPVEIARGVLFESEEAPNVSDGAGITEAFTTTSQSCESDDVDSETASREVSSASTCTSASDLLLSPLRLVSSGVAMAIAVPTAVVCFGGRQASKAVQTSQQLAISATRATARGVTKSTMYVAGGITHGVVTTATMTASTCADLVGNSVQMASNAIPESVSTTFWNSIDTTSKKSTSAVSYLVAMPTYKLMTTVYPELQEVMDEETCVQSTQQVVHTLVRVLGPQNAFYLVKTLYQTVKSEETKDMLLLCRDVASESVNKENYKQLGKTIGRTTKLTDLYEILPSFDEMLDVAYLIGDVSEEFVDQMQKQKQKQPGEVSENEEGKQHEGGGVFTTDTFGFEAPLSSTETSSWLTDEEPEYFVDGPPESVGFILGEDCVFDGHLSDCDVAPPPASNCTQISLSEGEPDAFFIDEPPQSMGFIEDLVVFEAPSDAENVVQEQDEIKVKKPPAKGGIVDSGINLLTDFCDSDRTFRFFNAIGNALDEIID